MTDNITGDFDLIEDDKRIQQLKFCPEVKIDVSQLKERFLAHVIHRGILYNRDRGISRISKNIIHESRELLGPVDMLQPGQVDESDALWEESVEDVLALTSGKPPRGRGGTSASKDLDDLKKRLVANTPPVDEEPQGGAKHLKAGRSSSGGKSQGGAGGGVAGSGKPRVLNTRKSKSPIVSFTRDDDFYPDANDSFDDIQANANSNGAFASSIISDYTSLCINYSPTSLCFFDGTLKIHTSNSINRNAA